MKIKTLSIKYIFLSLKFTTFQQKFYLFKEENIIIYVLSDHSRVILQLDFVLKDLFINNYFSANGINLHYFPAVRGIKSICSSNYPS